MPLPAILGGATFFKAMTAWFIANVACKLIFRIMFSLGIGVITYVGGDIVLDLVQGQIQTGLNDLVGPIRGVMARCRVGECISIMFSAATYALTLRFTRASLGFVGNSKTGGGTLGGIW